MSLNWAEGEVFAGRYRVVRGIATGAMGAVYEVVHIETERRQALKVMHPHLAENPEFRARFKLEARIAARIESDHIVEVLDAGIDAESGMPFLVMELLRGEELSKYLRRVGRLPPEEAIVYLRQTALALDKTHAAGVVHRDLKPANLFMAKRDDDTPRIKVLDFGIAKLVAETALGSATTATLGTPLYMAPEQFNGEPISPAVDIFALGMIAYTLLVGTAYWTSDMRSMTNSLAFAVVAMHGPQEPACARAAGEGVTLPPAFDAWFARMTAREPEKRFPTAVSAIDSLAEVFGLAPMSARPSLVLPVSPPTGRGRREPTSEPAGARSSTGVVTPVVTPSPRSRKTLAIAALAVAGGAAALLAVVMLGGGGRPRSVDEAPSRTAQAASPAASAPDRGQLAPARSEAPSTAQAPQSLAVAPGPEILPPPPVPEGSTEAPEPEGPVAAPARNAPANVRAPAVAAPARPASAPAAAREKPLARAASSAKPAAPGSAEHNVTPVPKPTSAPWERLYTPD